MMNSGARAVLVGHAEFATGMVSAVEQICGRGGLLIPLSNGELDSAAIEELVAGVLSESGVRVVFSDVPAGSATMAVRRLQRSMPDLTLIAGVNLAILLEFVQNPGDPNQRAVLEAADKGRAAIIPYGAKVAG
jgi:PTS system N-acetylgalactosamine-specific IIA component